MEIPSQPSFIDLFAGCGGLSLGLMQAGWKGTFAIEKDPLAFKTLDHNLIKGSRYQYDWPDWLPQHHISIEKALIEYETNFEKLFGEIDLVAGGPPCQGFSTAGRRLPDDPRNLLFKKYLEVISTIRPKAILLENVKGMSLPFSKNGRNGIEIAEKQPYASLLIQRLEHKGYFVTSKIINCADYGIPQNRYRLFIVGIRKDLIHHLCGKDFFDILDENAKEFLLRKKIGTSPVPVKDAISDLETVGRRIVPCIDGPSNSRQILYGEPLSLNGYQRLMRDGMNGAPPNSLRLLNHKKETIEKLKTIISTCEKGKSLNKHDRQRFGIKKQALFVLSPDKPSSTVTTIPEDILHYSEPRSFTARENARLQSFPDWFSFQGKYSTGGSQRKLECPRYTQIGNAVPPMMAEIMGKTLKKILCGVMSSSETQKQVS